MRPIPKHLLIHTADIVTEAPDPDDSFSEKTIVTRKTLTHIRLEPLRSLTVSKTNEQVKVSAVLFYDCTLSRPSGFAFTTEQRVEFGGNMYNIVGISEQYDERKLHHYEVELCL